MHTQKLILKKGLRHANQFVITLINPSDNSYLHQENFTKIYTKTAFLY